MVWLTDLPGTIASAGSIGRLDCAAAADPPAASRRPRRPRGPVSWLAVSGIRILLGGDSGAAAVGLCSWLGSPRWLLPLLFPMV